MCYHNIAPIDWYHIISYQSKSNFIPVEQQIKLVLSQCPNANQPQTVSPKRWPEPQNPRRRRLIETRSQCDDHIQKPPRWLRWNSSPRRWPKKNDVGWLSPYLEWTHSPHWTLPTLDPSKKGVAYRFARMSEQAGGLLECFRHVMSKTFVLFVSRTQLHEFTSNQILDYL